MENSDQSGQERRTNKRRRGELFGHNPTPNSRLFGSSRDEISGDVDIRRIHVDFDREVWASPLPEDPASGFSPSLVPPAPKAETVPAQQEYRETQLCCFGMVS